MSGKLEVSFNSPQCGWMSIGFSDGQNEFHTTTANAPHRLALSQLLQILTSLLDPDAPVDANTSSNGTATPRNSIYGFCVATTGPAF